MDERPAGQPLEEGTPESPAPHSGWVELAELEMLSVLKVATVLTIPVAIAGCALSVAAAALMAVLGVGEGAIMATLAAAMSGGTAQPLATGVQALLGAIIYNYDAAHGHGVRLRLQPAGEFRRVPVLQATSLARAAVAWNLPTLAITWLAIALLAVVLGLTGVVIGTSHGGPHAAAHGLGLGGLLGVGGVILALLSLPLLVGACWLGGWMVGGLFNWVAYSNGGLKGRFEERDGWTELTDVQMKPTALTLFALRLPGVLLAVAVVVGLMYSDPKGAPQLVRLLGLVLALAMAPWLQIYVYNALHQWVGGYRFKLRPVTEP